MTSKWANPLCAICHHNDWQLGGLVEMRPYEGGTLVVGGAVYPLLQITCGNCAHTVLFNAVVAGLLPRAQGDSAPPAQEHPEKG